MQNVCTCLQKHIKGNSTIYIFLYLKYFYKNCKWEKGNYDNERKKNELQNNLLNI